MMRKLSFRMLLVLLGILLVAACKKEDDEDPEPEDCNVVYITQKITENTTFKSGNVYIIDINGDFQIEATLTIEPGVVIKSLRSYQRYLVKDQGKLIAQGTVEKPVIFTSQYDNTHGCDMTGDGTPPAPGDWGQVQFVEVEGSVLSYCQFYYGGGFLLATVEAIRSSVEISNCTFAFNKGGYHFGYKGTLDLNLANTDCIIKDNVFYSNNLPVSTTANMSFDNSNSFSKPGSPEIKNVFNGIFTNDYTIDYDITWAETEVAFVIGNYSGLRMEDMASLTLADNVVLKFDESSNFDIRSDITSIINYNGNGVFFTSIKDDSLKGDANGDGSSSAPAVGDWDGIIIDDGPLTYAGWPNILFAANP